jgi:octaprenyl-diphosphate synthase
VGQIRKLLSMTTMPTTTANPPDLLQALYAPIAGELAQVEQLLRSELRSDYPFVDELVRYGCLLGGKRLRPALLLLAAKAVGPRRANMSRWRRSSR